jgi:hypothetical protein
MDWSDQSRRYKISKGASWTNSLPELQSATAFRDTLDPYQRTIVDRLFGPIRWDYPNQGFWDRGFRVVLAREIADRP